MSHLRRCMEMRDLETKASVLFRGKVVSRTQRRVTAAGGHDPRTVFSKNPAISHQFDAATRIEEGFDPTKTIKQNARAMFEARLHNISDDYVDGKLTRKVRRAFGGLDDNAYPRMKYSPAMKAYYEKRAAALLREHGIA